MGAALALALAAAAVAVAVVAATLLAARARRTPKFLGRHELEATLQGSSAYLRHLTAADLAARRGHVLSADDWRAFEPAEARRLTALCAEADAALRGMGAAHLLRVPWRLCKLAAHAENGWPFTLGAAIMLPEACLPRLTAHTLVHERVHVLQRVDPLGLLDMYEAKLGLRVAGIADEFPDSNARSNPDIGRLRFGAPAAEGRLLFPEQRYRSAAPSGLAEADVVLVDAASGRVAGGEAEARRLLRVPDYVAQAEHPHEVVACVAAQLSENQARSQPPPADPWADAVGEWLKGGSG